MLHFYLFGGGTLLILCFNWVLLSLPSFIVGDQVPSTKKARPFGSWNFLQSSGQIWIEHNRRIFFTGRLPHHQILTSASNGHYQDIPLRVFWWKIQELGLIFHNVFCSLSIVAVWRFQPHLLIEAVPLFLFE